ncbi:MAG: MarR family winged helix-turn-helix transcriptional regulator [Gelidibacter sp.]
MEKSIFNTGHQQMIVASKIVIGLERVSELFKVLLWEHAKATGLSPTQIQLLIFIANHKPDFCNVSHLANEFNVTKPTISDAVKALDKKELIIKDFSGVDNRSYTIHLSDKGKTMVSKIQSFTDPIKKRLVNLDGLDNLYATLTELIYGLHKSGLLTVQRICFACKFHEVNDDNHHCNLLNKPLQNNDIQLDCPEFESKSS